MKKIIYIFSTIALLTGCNLDINDNPNSPTDVAPGLILPAAQSAIAATVGDGMYNYAGFFAQYYDQMPEANQYNNIAEYDFTIESQLMDRNYRTLYAGALEDLKQIINKSDNPSDIFACTVLRAFSFQLLVDNTDQTPYTEALQGSTITQPKWDSGQSVYEGVLKEMDDAEALTGNDNLSHTDLIFNKSISQWKGFANALRLRMYFRFVDAGVDVPGYTAKIRALIDNGHFFTGDVKFDAYSDEADKRNPWYSANRVRLAINHVAAYPIVSYLKATNDPRIAYNFEVAENTDDYEGEIPGSKRDFNMKNADFSGLKYYPTKPVYFFTQSQLQFLIAEAYVRFYNDDARAKAAYQAGIDADFLARGMTQSHLMYAPGASLEWNSAAAPEQKLELIYMQKWVALCYMDHMEAWSEIRRTDCPKFSNLSGIQINENSTLYTPGDLIIPVRNALAANGGIVKRLFPSYDAFRYNPNTPRVQAHNPVWWDKN